MLERSEASKKPRNCHPNCSGGTDVSAQKTTRDNKTTGPVMLERSEASKKPRNGHPCTSVYPKPLQNSRFMAFELEKQYSLITEPYISVIYWNNLSPY